MDTAPAVWLVVAADGFRAVFLIETRAVQYAVACHGVVWPLFTRGAPA